MSRSLRLAVRAPLAILTLSAGCTQVLGIEDARIDSTLAGGARSPGGGAGLLSGAGEQSSGGTVGTAGAETHEADAGMVGPNGGAEWALAGAGGGDAPDQPSTCETYCDAVLKNCKGKYEQYRTFDQCIAVCKLLPAGTPGDVDVNTIECRMRQAYFAESEAFLYCKSAGPLGAGKCGSNCVSYCSLMGASCSKSSTAGNIELSYFDSTQDCLSDCASIPDDPSGPVQYSSSATVDPSTLVGNSVYCRTYHVTAGIEQDAPSEHCPHAMGGDPCIAQ